jgi:hypothetical protein
VFGICSRERERSWSFLRRCHRDWPGLPPTPIRTREVADERLSAVVGQLEDTTGASVEGTVGADDPLLAFEDAIADFNPHHILIALRPSEESGWQERGLIEEVGERFGLPLTVFRITS